MGDVKKNAVKTFAKKFRLLKKKWFIVAAVLAIAIAAGIAVWWYISNSALQSDSSRNESKVTTAKKKVTELDNEAGASPSKQVLKETQTELTHLADQSSTNAEKQVYLLKSIQLYINNKDYSSALTVAEQSEELNPTALTAANIALAYMGLNEYQKAADYYQIAADRSGKTDDPTARSPYNDYMILKKKAEALIK